MTMNEFISHLSSMPRRLRRECRKFINNTKYLVDKPCPITAVTEHTTGQQFTISKAATAAQLIKLSKRNASQIIDAADCNKYGSSSTIKKATLRSRILSALGTD